MSSKTTLERENRQVKIALLSIDGIGQKTWQKLEVQAEERQLSLIQAWKELNSRPEAWGLSESQRQNLMTFQQRWQPADYEVYLQEQGIEAVLVEDEVGYPALLREVIDRPEILFVKGQRSILSELKIPIAVVGTRKISLYGRQATRKISQELVLAGAEIISGFMYGVDVLAQQVAMENGGKTIGVLGFGFDHCFPRSQKRLMEEMLAAGQIFITEYAPWVTARPGTFPQRNRIVAGMSWATVVIEAAARSGSLITAGLAADYGRLVAAVPGPIMSLYSEGTKNLLKAGATLAGSGREIIAELRGEMGWDVHERNLIATGQSCLGENLSAVQNKIIKVLQNNPSGLSLEVILLMTQLQPAELQSEVFILEMQGKIKIEGELVALS